MQVEDVRNIWIILEWLNFASQQIKKLGISSPQIEPTQSYKSEDNSSVPEIISTGSPNSNTNLPINNDTSNLQEKQPSDENTETNKIEEITTPGNEISESNVWTGTVREAEIAFQTKLIEGIDTIFDRKTDRRFSGKMEIFSAK